MERYAIYWAPASGSALAEFGRRWLGSDPERGAPSDRRDSFGLDPGLVERATVAPRRYGLQASMRLPSPRPSPRSAHGGGAFILGRCASFASPAGWR
jgi:hypothetical protein